MTLSRGMRARLRWLPRRLARIGGLESGGAEDPAREGAPKQHIKLMVNGERYELEVAPSERLLEVLRARLRLTGSKQACGRGECGACTVLIDGTPRLACITLAGRVEGEVTTIEGLAGRSVPLRAAFGTLGGLQCGFCTPGQIVQATHLLDVGLPERDEDLRDQLAGNICRCTGYMAILEAIRSAETDGLKVEEPER